MPHCGHAGFAVTGRRFAAEEGRKSFTGIHVMERRSDEIMFRRKTVSSIKNQPRGAFDPTQPVF